MANANQVIVNGETILDLRSDTVTPETLQKGYTAHDKSGAKITGTLEASSSSGAKETWVLNETPDMQNSFSYDVNFISDGKEYGRISANKNSYQTLNSLLYYPAGSTRYSAVFVGDYSIWDNQAHRKLTFDTPPTGDLLTWLQANGVKQPDDTAVQDTKALTITSNGTVSVTPDAPYDALKKVDVTVNVASGGVGGGTTTSLKVILNDSVDATLFCIWQTSNGWMGTANFDTSANFTIPNVIVGGYVIFTHDPNEAWHFSASDTVGVEDLDVGAMDAQWDIPNAALVLKVTAPSPKCIFSLSR